MVDQQHLCSSLPQVTLRSVSKHKPDHPVSARGGSSKSKREDHSVENRNPPPSLSARGGGGVGSSSAVGGGGGVGSSSVVGGGGVSSSAAGALMLKFSSGSATGANFGHLQQGPHQGHHQQSQQHGQHVPSHHGSSTPRTPPIHKMTSASPSPPPREQVPPDHYQKNPRHNIGGKTPPGAAGGGGAAPPGTTNSSGGGGRLSAENSSDRENKTSENKTSVKKKYLPTGERTNSGPSLSEEALADVADVAGTTTGGGGGATIAGTGTGGAGVSIGVVSTDPQHQNQRRIRTNTMVFEHNLPPVPPNSAAVVEQDFFSLLDESSSMFPSEAACSQGQTPLGGSSIQRPTSSPPSCGDISNPSKSFCSVVHHMGHTHSHITCFFLSDNI